MTWASHDISLHFSALVEVKFLHEAWREEYKDLFDMNRETCLDSKMTLLQMNRPHLDLVIAQVGTEANITVYFNQTVECKQREVGYYEGFLQIENFLEFPCKNSINYCKCLFQVVYVWKEHSNKTCTTQRYLKSCNLMTTGSDVTSCSYRCPCEDNQCRVDVVDDEQQFRVEPANICEITYQLEG